MAAPGRTIRDLRGPMVGFAIALLAAAGLPGLLAYLDRPKPWPEALRIATATEGGTYNVIGEGLALVLAGDPARRVPPPVARTSNGSGENLDRLVAGETELALLSGAVLRRASAAERARVRTLARLYDGYMQLVVRTDAGIQALDDLRGKRIYIGKSNSGTETIARGILQAADLDGAWTRAGSALGFRAAAEALARPSGGIDAAIFGGGIPTAAVRACLDAGAGRLLGLGDVAARVAERMAGLGEATIPAGFYRGQDAAIHTVAAPALLVARADLPASLVERVLTLLFDDTDDLLAYALHQPGWPGVVAIEAIGIQSAFPGSEGPYHAGVERFLEAEEDKLVIATGALGGRYHQIGLQIQMLLEQAGIGARAIHTAGSLENARILQTSERPTIAIMQYDAALAAYWGKPRLVYKPTDPAGPGWTANGIDAPAYVPDLRTIVRLHEERMHILARAEIVDDLSPGAVPTVDRLAGRRVCLGPRGSATQALARAILHHHGVRPATTIWLPFRDMQRRLRSQDEASEQDLDAGFFCGGRPSLALQGLLGADTGIRLLAVRPERIVQLTLATSALEETAFEREDAGAYGCLRGAVPAVATRSMLVTRAENPHVAAVTRVVLQGAGVLPGIDDDPRGVAGIEQSMAAPLASLLPHPDAVAVFEERGLRTAPDRRIIESVAGLLGILAILVATARGLRFLRQEQLAEEIHGRVLAVSLEASTEDSVRRLAEIRDDVRRRAQRRWWSSGGLSKKRWTELEGMIEQRSDLAKSNLCTALLAEARALRHRADDDVQGARDDVRARIWRHAEHGELSEMQVLLALRALGDEVPSVPTRRRS